MVRPERFELPTSWFVARRSIQLSYGRAQTQKTLFDWRRGRDGLVASLLVPPLRCGTVGADANVSLPLHADKFFRSVSSMRTAGDSVPTGGEGGIRTLDGLLTHTPLAGARLRPLGHLSHRAPAQIKERRMIPARLGQGKAMCGLESPFQALSMTLAADSTTRGSASPSRLIRS